VFGHAACSSVVGARFRSALHGSRRDAMLFGDLSQTLANADGLVGWRVKNQSSGR
jgi:hypothetical protein